MRLAQLLEQEGQPCSYCIAVFLVMQGDETLSLKDAAAYGRHLREAHGLGRYSVQP